MLRKRASLSGFEHCFGALWMVITPECAVLSVTHVEFRAAIGKISGSTVCFTYLKRSDHLVCENYLGAKKRNAMEVGGKEHRV